MQIYLIQQSLIDTIHLVCTELQSEANSTTGTPAMLTTNDVNIVYTHSVGMSPIPLTICEQARRNSGGMTFHYIIG